MKSKQLTLNFLTCAILAAALSLGVTACNSGTSTSPSGSTSNPTGTYVLPDGSVLLPNGAKVSTSSNTILAMPGKSTFSKIIAKGGSSKLNLGLKAAVFIKQNGMLKPSTALQVSIIDSALTTGSNHATEIKFDAKNATAGTYQVQITADKLTNAPVIATFNVAVSTDNMVKASYLQLDSLGSLGSITASGYAASNMVIFAFANPTTSDINQSYLASMQKAINSEAPGTINLVSLGGQIAEPENFHDVPQVINNITNQINSYNTQLSGGKISGVDLDLEGEFTPEVIQQLAKGFKEKGLIVAAAPQVYTTGSPQDVDTTNPTNLVLTAGWPGDSHLNTYGPAIASGYVDYILAQTYNTGGWKVGGYEENQVEFFTAIATALNNSVKDDCSENLSATSPICIPKETQIVVGEVSNAGASGTVNNIFGSNGTTQYDQANILAQLLAQINPVLSSQANVTGVMQWSLNNDYMPNGWYDNYAQIGAFSSTIFGATPPPAIPYFILQVTNTGPDVAGPSAYSSATLVVNGQYWIFGTNAPWTSAGMVPIAPGTNGYQQWGTLPSSLNPATPGVVDSSNLDQIFSNGNTSFTTSQILINGYPSYDSSINNPTGQWVCDGGANFTFEAGHSYNLMVNAASPSCEIKKIN